MWAVWGMAYLYALVSTRQTIAGEHTQYDITYSLSFAGDRLRSATSPLLGGIHAELGRFRIPPSSGVQTGVGMPGGSVHVKGLRTRPIYMNLAPSQNPHAHLSKRVYRWGAPGTGFAWGSSTFAICVPTRPAL